MLHKAEHRLRLPRSDTGTIRGDTAEVLAGLARLADAVRATANALNLPHGATAITEIGFDRLEAIVTTSFYTENDER